MVQAFKCRSLGEGGKPIQASKGGKKAGKDTALRWALFLSKVRLKAELCGRSALCWRHHVDQVQEGSDKHVTLGLQGNQTLLVRAHMV